MIPAQAPVPLQPVIQNHALDSAVNNILPLEGALVPYPHPPSPPPPTAQTGNEEQQVDNNIMNFDILSMLNDLEDDNEVE